MRKLKIIEHISLDGVIRAPGGPTEDGDYPHGGWTVPLHDPAVGGAVLAEHAKSFDLLLGRQTYDIWAGYWPKAPNDSLADSLNAATKYVGPTGLTASNGVRSKASDETSSRHSPHQGEERARPDPLGQFDADTDIAGARACG